MKKDIQKHRMSVRAESLNRVQLSVTPWTVAHQAPLPMGFSRREYWSGMPFPSPLIEHESHVSCFGRWFLSH